MTPCDSTRTIAATQERRKARMGLPVRLSVRCLLYLGPTSASCTQSALGLARRKRLEVLLQPCRIGRARLNRQVLSILLHGLRDAAHCFEADRERQMRARIVRRNRNGLLEFRDSSRV